MQLTDQSDAEWQQAFGLMQRFDIDKGVNDIQATIDHPARLPGRHRQGGRAWATAWAGCWPISPPPAPMPMPRSAITASTSRSMLDEADTIKNPLMLHIAEADDFVPPPAQEKIIAGLKDNPHVTLAQLSRR